MNQYNIAVIVGSLRKDSYNRQLADAIVKLAPPEFVFRQAEIGDLPLYNQDDDENQPEPVKRLKREIEGAQGLLFVTPEYNRSIPGVLKNAIDQASRPHGQNAWAGKPAGVLGASIGVLGTAMAQTAPAQHSGVSWRADTRPTRGVHPCDRRIVRRGWQHRRWQQTIPPELDGPVCRVGENTRFIIGTRDYWDAPSVASPSATSNRNLAVQSPALS